MAGSKLAAAMLAAVLAGAGCSAAPGLAQGNASSSSGAASLAPADLEFVLKAAEGGMAEIALGELALQKAGSDEVKAFARQMIEDHRKANDALMQIATPRGTTPPKELSPTAQSVRQALSVLSGEDFDQAYMAQQYAAHEVTAALFEHAAENAELPDLSRYAKEYGPIIEKHSDAAENLVEEMD